MESMTVNGRPYAVRRLLGHGKGGYSYLAADGAGEYVLKQIHHEPCDYYQFGDKLAAERHDYRRLCAAGVRLPRLLAVDEPNERLLKEYIDGPTVAELVQAGPLPPALLAEVQALSEALRRQGLNLDWYPTNFVVRDGLLYYVDYECNDYMEQWSFERWGVQYWVPAAPAAAPAD